MDEGGEPLLRGRIERAATFQATKHGGKLRVLSTFGRAETETSQREGFEQTLDATGECWCFVQRMVGCFGVLPNCFVVFAHDVGWHGNI